MSPGDFGRYTTWKYKTTEQQHQQNKPMNQSGVKKYWSIINWILGKNHFEIVSLYFSFLF